MYFHTEVMLHL